MTAQSAVGRVVGSRAFRLGSPFTGMTAADLPVGADLRPARCGLGPGAAVERGHLPARSLLCAVELRGRQWQSGRSGALAGSRPRLLALGPSCHFLPRLYESLDCARREDI